MWKKNPSITMMLQLASFPFLFTSLLLVFMVTMKQYWNRSKNQGGHIRKLPPGPKQLPIIGNLHQLIGSALPHDILRDLAKKYGPIMHLKLGEVSAIVISSPEVAEEVLKTQELNFAQRPNVFGVDAVGYGNIGIVFTPYGDYWKQMRKICTTELLSIKQVRLFKSSREEEACSLVESISSLSSTSPGHSFNLTHKIFQSANYIISRAAFGNKCKDTEDFISAMRQGNELAGGLSIPDLFPSFKFLTLIVSRMKPSLKKLHLKLEKVLNNIISESKARRAAKIDTPGDGQDHLVDVLLKLQESNGLEFPLNPTNIKALVLDVFGGGSDTTAITVEWAMSELLRNPQVMEKAQGEVRRVLKGKTEIKEEDTQELPYLKLIVKETLRLHPPLTLLPREAREACVINGYKIPKKAKIVVNLWAINRSAKHWENADCFQPERFQGSSLGYTGTNMEYTPFGCGRRICPGLSFGIATVEHQLAVLLYNFDWKLPGGMKPEELDMTEVFGGVVRRKNALHVTATPLSSFA